MKKKFVKPEIQRVILNYHENIVASNNFVEEGFLYMQYHDHYSCIVVYSGYTYAYTYANKLFNTDEVIACMVEPGARAYYARLMGIE